MPIVECPIVWLIIVEKKSPGPEGKCAETLFIAVEVSKYRSTGFDDVFDNGLTGLAETGMLKTSKVVSLL